MYASGQGVPQDYVVAHMWFSLSLALGNTGAAAPNRDRAAVIDDVRADRRTEKAGAGLEALAGMRAFDRHSPQCGRTAPGGRRRSAQALRLSFTPRAATRPRQRPAGSCRRLFRRSFAAALVFRRRLWEDEESTTRRRRCRAPEAQSTTAMVRCPSGICSSRATPSCLLRRGDRSASVVTPGRVPAPQITRRAPAARSRRTASCRRAASR